MVHVQNNPFCWQIVTPSPSTWHYSLHPKSKFTLCHLCRLSPSSSPLRPLRWLTPHPSASGPSCPGRLQSSWGLGSLVCPPGDQWAAYGVQALDLLAMSNIVTQGLIGANRPAKTTQHNSMDATTAQLQPITLIIPVMLFPHILPCS